MAISLRILLVIFAIGLFIIILKYISRNKLPIKYSLIWLTTSILIFIVGAFPNFIGLFTEFIGFETTSNFVIGIILILLLMITLILTMIVSNQKRQIELLIQETSMLKVKLEKIKGKDGD